MTKENILKKLRELMQESSQEVIDWETVTTEQEILSLGFDSLSMLDLICDVQQAFSLEIEPEDLMNLQTVGELVDFLDVQLQSAAS